MACNHAETSAFLDFVERYINTASHVPEGEKSLFPIMQLYGQATELALKAYLASTVGKWAKSHDLLRLAADAKKSGLALTSEQDERLALLNNVYFKLDSDGFKYASRYPRASGGVWLTPTKKWMIEIVESIAQQAKDRL